jgi:uncharacterized peroxidase-related enzyme
MQRLQAVNPETANGKTKELLDAVQAKLGMTPNLVRTFANSPAVLEAYLGFSGALSKGVLSAKLREQIALAVAEANGCGYCLAAHSAVGKMLGLSEEDIADSRRGISTDSKSDAVLGFARQMVEKRGWVSDEDLSRLRNVGYGDGEIAEVVANVALHLFTNYFNHVAETEVDFPEVSELAGR